MDAITRLREQLARRLQEDGLLVQHVRADLALEPDFTYTTGLSLIGHPELIVFGTGPAGGDLLRGLADEVRAGSLRLRAATVLDQTAGHPPIRIDPVRSEWAHEYAKDVWSLLDREDALVLQAVLPDPAGRWPDDPRADRAVAGRQPLLARRHPWLYPVSRGPDVDAFAALHRGDCDVLVPVIERGASWNGQYEALSATPLEDGTFLLRQPPCLADWVTAGARVTVEPRPAALRTDARHVVARVVEPTGHTNLAYNCCLVCQPEASRLLGAFRRLLAAPPGGFVAVSTTLESVHISTDDPDAVRRRLRPLQRDGWLRERELRSSVSDLTGPCSDPECLGHAW